MQGRQFNIGFISATILALGMTACRSRDRNGSEVAGLAGDDLVPTFYMNKNLSTGQNVCINHLANITSDAIADGLLMNGALSGLGTNTPVGPKLKTDSLYFQLLRIYSIFDWRFSDALRNGSISCLPEQVAFGIGNLPRPYVEDLPKPYRETFDKFRSTLQAMSRDAPNFAVVEAEAFVPPEQWPKGLSGDESFRQYLSVGGTTALSRIRRESARTDDLKAKLKGMASGFAPLIVSYNSQFPAKLDQGTTYLEAYLPPLYELEVPDLDAPLRWKLRAGISKRELPRIIDISIAKLTHIGYLAGLPTQDEPIIKAQLYKDYANPDKVVVRAVFGKVAANGGEPGYIPMEYRDFRSALVISFFPHLAISPEDSALLRRAKQEFNDLTNVIKVDARIHQLTVELERTPKQNPVTHGVDAVLYQPHFSLKDSDISFRVYLDASSTRGRQSLEATGFVCQTVTDVATASCYRDFGAFEELNRYFEDEQNGLASMSENSGWAGQFKRGLNALIRYNTRFLINWNMDAIEQAIDAQFIEIFSSVADRQAEIRQKIQDRLERELFSAQSR